MLWNQYYYPSNKSLRPVCGSWLSSSGKCPLDLSKHCALLLVESKVPALQNVTGECLLRVLSPSLHRFSRDQIIFVTGPGGNRAFQREIRKEGVGIVQFEIRAQARSEELHNLTIGEHFLGSPAEISQPLHKLVIRQVIDRVAPRAKVREPLYNRS